MSPLLLAVVVSAAPDWSTSFDANAVQTYLEGDSPVVLVLPANTTDESAVAANALVASLRSIKRVRLVMDSAPLGALTGLSDEQLVAKAKGMPADLIAIVRVFPSADQPTAVVMLYGKAGVMVSALTVTKGKPLVPREGGASLGVSQATVSAVTAVTKAHENGEDLSEYERKRIFWVHESTSWVDPLQGKNNRLLSGTELYEALGRADLAESFNTRHHTRRAFGVASYIGFTVAGIGASLGLTACLLNVVTSPSSSGFANGCGDAGNVILVSTGVILGLSIVSLIASVAIPRQPVSFSELKALVEQHNAKLAKELSALEMDFDVVADRSGVGFGLRGRF